MCYWLRFQPRKKCDDDFKENMKVSCHWNKDQNFMFYFCHFKAKLAYLTTRTIGTEYYTRSAKRCHKIEKCNPNYITWKDKNNEPCSSYDWELCKIAKENENMGSSGLNCPECRCKIN